MRKRLKPWRGQGLVEFALILPLLLMIIIGIFEFGRILLIYSNLFNAAREGARYGITNPRDYSGIHHRSADQVILVAQDDPDFHLWVQYDNGPGGDPHTNHQAVTVGDRVLVRIQYPVRPMTPLFEPLIGEIPLDTQAARTIQSLGTLISLPPPEGPQPPGDPGDPGEPGDPGDPSDPADPQITIDPICGPAGSQGITVSGSGWTEYSRIDIYFDSQKLINNRQISQGSFTVLIDVTVDAGTYVVEVLGRGTGQQDDLRLEALYTVPCPEAPPPPTLAPIEIDRPVIAGETQVTGSAEPGEEVQLYINGTYQATAQVSTAGRFVFDNLAALQAGATLLVQGYDEYDSLVVEDAPPVDPIIIDRPVMAGQTQVTGSAEPEEEVELLINGTYLATTTVDPEGRFAFGGLSALQAGATVIVQGYGEEDLAVVEGVTAREPITITKPVMADATAVVGDAEPHYAVTLRIIQTGLQRTVTVDAEGAFEFPELPPLVEGHTIVVEGYGHQDLAVVQSNAEDEDPYVYIDEACLDPGNQTFTVYVRNIPEDMAHQQHRLRFFWNGQQITEQQFTSPDFEGTLQLNNVTSPGPHSLRVDIVDLRGQGSTLLQIPAIIPVCASTLPDLIVSGISITDDPLPGTHERVHLSVSITNIGDAHVTSLFWVDLYANFDPDIPLNEQSSVDYVAVNALSAGSTITFTMYVPDGFAETGTHTMAAMVDTWDQIQEEDEDNNVSETLSITITEENPPPDPEPIYEGPTGNLTGETFLDNQPTAGISIYLYAPDGRLVASGRSGADGIFSLSDIPVGDYNLVGEYREADAYAAATVAIEITEGLTQAQLYLETLEGTSP